MTSDRKKPTAGFWITVALVAALVGYPLSFGPACWAESQVVTVSFTYCHRPLLRIANGPGIIADSLLWYANAGTRGIWCRGRRELTLLQYIPPGPIFKLAR